MALRVSKASRFSSRFRSTLREKGRIVKRSTRPTRPTKKTRASKASGFTSKKSSKKFSLIKAKQPKKSLVSPFLTRFKSTSKVSKFAKSRGKRPKSSFIVSSKKLSKAKPEISSFIASTSSPTFKTRKVGKSKVFSTARLSAKPQTTTVTTKTAGGSLIQILEDLKSPTSIPKNGTSFPPTPDSTSGDETNFFDSIADFFNNFFGGSTSPQETASDTGTITTINFSPVTLPSQDSVIVEDGSGILDIEPRESFGLGIGGVSVDEGEDKDGLLNSIVNDPIKLGLAIIVIIGGIAGFTGGK